MPDQRRPKPCWRVSVPSGCGQNSPPALKYVRDCIPPPMDGPVSVDWRYRPASTLGGDTIGYHWVDDDHLALYLIDVTGHGLDAALLSVTVANVIRAGALPGADMRQPGQVLAKLNDAFQGEHHGNRFFTIWYGVYGRASRTMTWGGGGHPPSIVLLRGEPVPLLLAFYRPDYGGASQCRFRGAVLPHPDRARAC